MFENDLWTEPLLLVATQEGNKSFCFTFDHLRHLLFSKTSFTIFMWHTNFVQRKNAFFISIHCPTLFIGWKKGLKKVFPKFEHFCIHFPCLELPVSYSLLLRIKLLTHLQTFSLFRQFLVLQEVFVSIFFVKPTKWPQERRSFSKWSS